MADGVTSIQFNDTAEPAAPEGHDQQMADLYNNQNSEQDSVDNSVQGDDQQDNRPEWLPEKFKSAEDLANAYKELEKQFTKLRQNPNQQPDSQDPPDQQPDSKTQADDKKSFDYMLKEFHETGKVSEETLKALNITPQQADRYIKGTHALIKQTQQEAFEAVGGEENYKAMQTWAKENLSASQKEAFDAAIQAGPDVAKLAILGVYTQFKQAGGPRVVRGDRVGGGDTKGFADLYEFTTAIQDPKYQKSSSYREQVLRKLANSKL